MVLTLTLDDAEFIAAADRGLDSLEHDADKAAWNAGDEGVKAEQAEHPYTDRTYNLSASAHTEASPDGGVDMVWPAEYASFVDQGTSRSKPYPFVPIAEDRASDVLQYDLANAIDAFKDKVGG